jgi:hypothetical protein
VRAIVFILSIVGLLLGGLWLLQGLGLIHIRPILCFANCAPIQEASTIWAVLGALVTALSVLGFRYTRQRRPDL